jgi:hypothetical protein
VSLSHTEVSWNAPENKMQICSWITKEYSRTFYMYLRFERNFRIYVRDTAYPTRSSLVAFGNIHFLPTNFKYPKSHKVTYRYLHLSQGVFKRILKHVDRFVSDYTLSHGILYL